MRERSEDTRYVLGRASVSASKCAVEALIQFLLQCQLSEIHNNEGGRLALYCVRSQHGVRPIGVWQKWIASSRDELKQCLIIESWSLPLLGLRDVPGHSPDHIAVSLNAYVERMATGSN